MFVVTAVPIPTAALGRRCIFHALEGKERYKNKEKSGDPLVAWFTSCGHKSPLIKAANFWKWCKLKTCASVGIEDSWLRDLEGSGAAPYDIRSTGRTNVRRGYFFTIGKNGQADFSNTIFIIGN